MKEGIYVFGGKNKQGEATNSFINIQLGHSYAKLEAFSTIGIPPKARYGHCAHFLRDHDYYVIYGGRNDKIFNYTGRCTLDDIVVLNLKYLSWC
jgi:hypothetical protein